jgi:FixJ family two-component response regulator
MTRRVVVVEDDASLGRAMERVLRVGGLDPRVFDSAEHLLASGEEANASCMVLDVQLPGLDGFALHDRLRDSGFTGPIIFATAFDDREARMQAERRSPAAFMAKPFTGRSLLAAVRDALSQTPAEPPFRAV